MNSRHAVMGQTRRQGRKCSFREEEAGSSVLLRESREKFSFKVKFHGAFLHLVLFQPFRDGCLQTFRRTCTCLVPLVEGRISRVRRLSGGGCGDVTAAAATGREGKGISFCFSPSPTTFYERDRRAQIAKFQFFFSPLLSSFSAPRSARTCRN